MQRARPAANPTLSDAKKGAPSESRTRARAFLGRPVASQIRRHAMRGRAFGLPIRCPFAAFRAGNFWAFLEAPTRAREHVNRTQPDT